MPVNLVRVVIDHVGAIVRSRDFNAASRLISQSMSGETFSPVSALVTQGLGLGRDATAAIYLTTASRARVSPLMWSA